MYDTLQAFNVCSPSIITKFGWKSVLNFFQGIILIVPENGLKKVFRTTVMRGDGEKFLHFSSKGSNAACTVFFTRLQGPGNDVDLLQ